MKGSKCAIVLSIAFLKGLWCAKNPNENYGPFISLFSIGLDRKDESSYGK